MSARILFACLAVASGCAGALPCLAADPIAFEQRGGSLLVTAEGRPLATYVWRDSEILRPYFAHLHAPGGVQVTRNHPPVEGQDATDHATFHPGLWLAFGDVSGADFWRNKATVKHVEFVEAPAVDAAGGGFAVKNAYVSKDQPICEEVCRVRFAVRPVGHLITCDSRFSGLSSSGQADFYFGDQEEMGLGVRLATPLTVKQGGRIVNSDGLVNEKQVWGKQADWCDYSGTIDGQAVGVLLMPHPKNFRRSWFHARDYGVLVANPFGQNAFTKGERSKIEMRAGESLRLRFGVLIHEGPVDLAAAYRDWLAMENGSD